MTRQLRHPIYLQLSGEELLLRSRTLAKKLHACDLCPRLCGADRISGQTGFCKTADKAIVSSFGPHLGEEQPLVGFRGSGTVFFAGCNLGCVFCQNSDISHGALGQAVTATRLAEIFLAIQDMGCHNLNLVTPTHVTPQILEALSSAIENGFQLPIVWNTGGYDSKEILAALNGVVDIYMPDFKLWNRETSKRLLQTDNYRNIAAQCLKEMHRQVGDLIMDENGIAQRGLLVRHLVLPNGLADTPEVSKFIAAISTNTYFNLMDQYRPCHMAHHTAGIDQTLTGAQFKQALTAVHAAGLTRLD